MEIDNIQRQQAFSNQGYELLFNDSGKGGRRVCGVRVLPESPQYPIPPLHCSNFGALVVEPLGDVAQIINLRGKVVECGPPLFLTTHRRQLTLEDDNRDRRTLMVWDGYATRSWEIGKTYVFLAVERSLRKVHTAETASSSSSSPGRARGEEQLNAWYNASVLLCEGDLASFALP